MSSHRFIEQPGTKPVDVVQLKQPLKLIEHSNQWQAVTWTIWESQTPKQQDQAPFSENVTWLMSGVLNLINILLIKASISQPITTLMFLDRSGRNGAYLFNRTWPKVMELLTSRGVDIEQLLKPTIKFMDVGLHEFGKEKDWLALSLIEDTYPPEDLTGNLMVVDEFIHTGTSANRAMVALKDFYQPQSLAAISLFTLTPRWYYNDLSKGIRDEGLISDHTRRQAQKLSPEVFMAAMAAIDQFSHSRQNLIERSYKLPVVGKLLRDMLLGDLRRVLPDRDFLETTPAHEFIRYAKTRGGYLGLWPTQKHIAETASLRQLLRVMVNDTFARGLVEL